jgi:hypothetical protein
LMNFTKRIVCLANSRKHSGRCIAGKEVLDAGFGGWIRPVSARQSAEVSEEERRYQNGASPKVLDVIEIPMIGAAPQLYQVENCILDAGYYWVKRGEAHWNDLKPLLDQPVSLWTNGDSTYHGSNDRMKLEIASQHKHSLILIRPDEPAIHVVTEGAQFGNPRRRVRAGFRYRGVYYGLIVTDPVAESTLLAKDDGIYPLKDVYLCISLGEAHTDGSCYKLVATVITRDPL